mmetsp:Transcript_7376/g.20341  ORF Transcript_7376/g.20341 Transcript_7376/m.20341 type:complete len:243 (+) Transcript_7376:355-1083(+)
MIDFFSRAMSPVSFNTAHCSMTLMPGGGGGVLGKTLCDRTIAIGVGVTTASSPASPPSPPVPSAFTAASSAPATSMGAAPSPASSPFGLGALSSFFSGVASTVGSDFSALGGVAVSAAAAAARREARPPSLPSSSFLSSGPVSPSFAASSSFGSGTSSAAVGMGFVTARFHAFSQKCPTSCATRAHIARPASSSAASSDVSSRAGGAPSHAALISAHCLAASNRQSRSAAKSAAIHRISIRT